MQMRSLNSSSAKLSLRHLQRNFILFLLAIVVPVVAGLWLYQSHTDATARARVLADVHAHARLQQLGIEQVLSVATRHVQQLGVQFLDAMESPELSTSANDKLFFAKMGIRTSGAGALVGDQLSPWWRERLGELYVSQAALNQPQLSKEIAASLALFPAMRAAHHSQPFFEWTYFYSPREDFSSIYPHISAAELQKATGTNNVDAMLKVVFNAGGTQPVQMIGPNRNPSRQIRWTAPYFDAGGKGAMASLLNPQYLNDQFVGVLGTDVTLKMFGDLLQKSRHALGHALVVDSVGHVLADDAGLVQDAKDILKMNSVLPAELNQIPLSRLVAKSNELQNLGQWHWIAIPLAGNQWHLLVYFSQIELNAAVQEQVENTPLIFAALVALIIVAAWGISYYFALPALRLVGFLDDLQTQPIQPAPLVPTAWQPSFNAVAATSQERANYLAEVQSNAEVLERTVDERTLALRQANEVLQQTVQQLKTAQKMLVESEKMAALGSLVAGVAHELNTPIGVGVTMSSTLYEKTDEIARQIATQTLRKTMLADYVEVTQQGLEILMRNLEQAAQLVASFKQVAVDQAGDQRREFDLAETIRNVLQTMQVLFGKTRITIHNLVPAGLILDSFPGALVQVLNNLIANTEAHAFIGRESGSVWIKVQSLTEQELQLLIEDDGLGIAPEHLPHIFEPFFTTKLGQGGSGLGLNIVYNAVNSVLGGQIEVDSKLGRGTRFTLTLPLTAPIKTSAA